MSSIQVIVYDLGIFRGPTTEARRYYLRNDSEQPPVAETNVNFLATFRPVRLNVPVGLRFYPDNEPPVVETNVHFLAKFRPAQQFSFYRSNLEDNQDIEPPALETNVHFTGQFVPVRTVTTAFRGFLFAFNGMDLSTGSQITTTKNLQLPINCVLIGDQIYDREDFYEGVPPGHGGLRIVQGMWGKKN